MAEPAEPEPMMTKSASATVCILFAPRKPLALLEDVEVHVVAHVALGCLLQRLEVPRVVGTVAQRRIDDPAARLALAHGGVEGGHVPAGPDLRHEGVDETGIGGIGGEVVAL